MKLIAICVFVICVISCTKKISPDGFYYSEKSRESIRFNKDFTYTYNYNFEFANAFSSGTWRKINSQIIELNSIYDNKKLPIHLTSSRSIVNLEGSTVIVEIPKALQENYNFIVSINNSLKLIQPSDSLIRINNITELNTLSVGITGNSTMPGRFFDTLYTDNFCPKSKDNFLTLGITYNDSLFNYKVMKSEKIFIKNRKQIIYKKNAFKYKNK